MPAPFSLAQMLGKQAPVIDIVDVGAMSLGGNPEYQPLLDSAPVRLIGFEPVQSECDKLNAGKHKNRTYLPYFIGDGSEATFYLTNFSMTSSLYEPDTARLMRYNNLEELTRVVETSKVQTKRMDDIPEITNIDLLKIDIQGAEVDAFRGASRLLDSALMIWTEVEFVQMYKNQPLFGDIDAELRKHGLMFHTFIHISGRALKPLVPRGDINGRFSQQLWADAVFIKDIMRFDELSEDKMLKLAIMCHDMIFSGDVTQLILQHYDRKFNKKLWKTYMTRLLGTDPGQPPLATYQ